MALVSLEEYLGAVPLDVILDVFRACGVYLEETIMQIVFVGLNCHLHQS